VTGDCIDGAGDDLIADGHHSKSGRREILTREVGLEFGAQQPGITDTDFAQSMLRQNAARTSTTARSEITIGSAMALMDAWCASAT
jgi:hypothetical protein